MENRRNYYRILHVQPDAPTEIIKSSYRTLMQKLRMHPDLGGDQWNATLINEAYETLTNPGKRAEYDRQGGAEPPAAAEAPSLSITAAIRMLACVYCHTAHGHGGPIPADALCAACGSPLQPASRQRLETMGKRATSRLARRHPLSYCHGWPLQGPFSGETRDISLGGLQFASVGAVAPAQLLKVSCDPLTAVVQVVACTAVDDPGFPWLVRAEYLTVCFRRSRGAFLSEQA
ncbi:MAG: J domain-containing protein [Gammaproteobacteria bacterium]